MPRPMLRTKQSVLQENTLLSASYKQENKRANIQMEKEQLDRLLRRQRSKEYIEAIHKLDAGGHVHNKEKVDGIIAVIQKEFPEVDIYGVMLGIIAVCYLGAPYEVHTLDLADRIVEHYKEGQPLPADMEKARSIAIRGGYEFIEVYADSCRAISLSGKVSVISL